MILQSFAGSRRDDCVLVNELLGAAATRCGWRQHQIWRGGVGQQTCKKAIKGLGRSLPSGICVMCVLGF